MISTGTLFYLMSAVPQLIRLEESNDKKKKRTPLEEAIACLLSKHKRELEKIILHHECEMSRVLELKKREAVRHFARKRQKTDS